LKLSRPTSTRQTNDPRAWLEVSLGVLLFLLVMAVFGQTRHFEFVSYDDDKNVYQNPVVAAGLSAASALWAFTHPQVANWVPLTTLSHMLDCQLFGLRAGGHHLVNVLWHAAGSVLLFVVVRQLTGAVWRSAFVAALFAIHPLRAESVAWVSERKDVLSGCFFMLTLWAYVRQVRHPSRTMRAATALLFALGLMAKSMLATLPFILLLLDYWPLGRWQNRRQLLPLVWEKMPLLILAAAALLAAVLTPGLVIAAPLRLPLFERSGNAMMAYVIYLRQMVFPAGLAIPYPAAPTGLFFWKVGAASAGLAGVSALVVAWRNKRPYLLAGWFWYLGMLFPVSGIIQIQFDASHADRYTYLPEIGLALAATWAVAEWSTGWKNRPLILGGLMLAVTGALAIAAHRQTACWKDDETLWTHALARTSGNSVAHNNLGLALARKGELDAAAGEFKKALEIHPEDAEVRYNMGVVFFAKGNYDAAIAEYRKSLNTEAANPQVYNNLGTALFAEGLEQEAAGQFQKAIALAPLYAEAHYNLGNVFLKQGRLEEAVGCYRRALEINPRYPDAQNNLQVAQFLKAQSRPPPKPPL
jgi:tetratricopeptide (TPR) repeat protein